MQPWASQRKRSGRLHDRLAIILALMVALTALPMGSNRATWWLLWTALLAAVACIAALRIGSHHPGHRFRVFRYRWLLAFTMVMPVWAWIQTLPFNQILPPGWPGDVYDPALTISVQPDVAASGILRFLGYIILVALVIEIASRRDRVLRFAQWIYAAICLQAVWAVVALRFLGDFSPWGAKTAYLGSATGTFVNRNSLATFLGFGLVLGLGILLERKQRRTIRPTRSRSLLSQLEFGDFLIVTGMAFLAIGLLMTQSRLGLTASMAGLLVAFCLVRSQSGTGSLRIALEAAGILVGMLALVLLLAAGQGVVDRFLLVGTEAIDRASLYSQIVPMIAARPLAGFGMDSFGLAFEAYRGPPLLSPVNYDLAHNSYLMLWAEFGFVFGSFPIISLTLVAVILVRRLRAVDGFKGMAVAGLGALVLGATHSLGDFSLEIPANNYLLMAILGLGLGKNMHIHRADNALLQGDAGGTIKQLTADGGAHRDFA